MKTAHLEYFANQIELKTHGTVSGGRVTNRRVQFHVVPFSPNNLFRLFLKSNSLSRQLGVPITIKRNRIEVDRKVLDAGISLTTAVKNMEIPKLTAILGLTEEGQPALFDFKAYQHLMVNDSALITPIVVSLALTNRCRSMVLSATEGMEHDFEGWPHFIRDISHVSHIMAKQPVVMRQAEGTEFVDVSRTKMARKNWPDVIVVTDNFRSVEEAKLNLSDPKIHVIAVTEPFARIDYPTITGRSMDGFHNLHLPDANHTIRFSPFTVENEQAVVRQGNPPQKKGGLFKWWG